MTSCRSRSDRERMRPPMKQEGLEQGKFMRGQKADSNRIAGLTRGRRYALVAGSARPVHARFPLAAGPNQ